MAGASFSEVIHELIYYTANVFIAVLSHSYLHLILRFSQGYTARSDFQRRWKSTPNARLLRVRAHQPVPRRPFPVSG